MRPKSGTTTGLLVLLVLSLAAYPVRGDVYIMTRTYNLDPIPDLGADFGPDVPDEGLEGQLRVADPEDACKPLVFKDLDTIWVALIARQQQFHPTMNCTFDIKVQHAQEAGAAAAIVYDDEYESLIIMSKPRGHPDPLIPSVFVTQKAGILMKKLLALEQEDGVRVRITPVSAVAWIGMVLSAVLGLLALTVVFSTFYILRSWSLWLSSGTTPPTGPRPPGAPAALAQPQRNTDTGLPPHVLRALPVLIYESQPPSRTRSLPNSMQHSQAAGSALEAAVAAEEAEGGLWLHGTSPTDADNKLPQSHQHAWRQGGADQGVRGGSVTGDSSSNSSEFEEQMRPVGVHAGETKRVCTVCLESYVEGDKLRVLPCHHRFHMQCIDQWLSNRRLCPVCKHDASKPLLQPHPRPRDQSPQAGAAAASAPEAGSGSSLVSTLANMRRAWRSRRSTQEQQPEEAAEAGMHSRRVAMRARLLRWLPMMRPFQRQALLAALNSQLTEPLLLNTATETTGTTETTTNSTNQQQGQGGAAASRPGRSAGPAGTAAGAAGADVDLEAGTQQPLGAGSGGVQQEPPTPQAGAAALNTLIAAGGGAAAAAAAAAGAGAAATGAGGGAAAAGAGAAPLIVQAVPVSRRSPGLGGPGGGGSTAADSSTRSV